MLHSRASSQPNSTKNRFVTPIASKIASSTPSSPFCEWTFRSRCSKSASVIGVSPPRSAQDRVLTSLAPVLRGEGRGEGRSSLRPSLVGGSS